MGAPKWMKDVADTFVPDISGRKAAEDARKKAQIAEALAAKDAADEAARQKAIKDRARATGDNPAGIQFKKGGSIDGAAKRGKTRGRYI